MRTLEIARIFALKDLRVALTYRLSFVLGIAAAFYGLVSFYFVTRVVGDSPTVGTPDDYFRFIVVGVVVSSILRASVSTAAANARRDQIEGTLEILAAQPVSPLALALGWSALPVTQALLDGLLTALVAIPLGFSGFTPDLLSTFVVLLVSLVAFLAIGFLGAALVLAIQQGIGVMGFITAGLALTSGAVFPVSVLPEPLQLISDISPLTYSLDAMRGALLDGDGLGTLMGDGLGILLIMCAVLLPLSLLVLAGALRYARARGTLARF
ncbi:MAG TPA: ABC transporter permease [Conexibacter sp.]|nr:ABC transporter permease [Conexibacter sp.]